MSDRVSSGVVPGWAVQIMGAVGFHSLKMPRVLPGGGGGIDRPLKIGPGRKGEKGTLRKERELRKCPASTRKVT